MTVATVKRWTGRCVGCDREDVEVAPRPVHGERMLCDSCADRPPLISAIGLDAPPSAPDATPPPQNTPPPTASVFQLLSLGDLANLRPPAFLIDGLLPQGGLSVLFGPSGVGKSFLALDWALCIAHGLAWWGRETKAGSVLYIAAEGHVGLGVRAAAWQTVRRCDGGDRIRFLPESVNLLDPGQVERAKRTLLELNERPALIVIDTMARSMVGGDENAARDVGLLVAAVDSIRATSRAAALVVHHTGKNGEDERGSSALRGAADMMHALKPDGAGLRLECVKAKDSEPYEPWFLHLQPTAKSCVLALGTRTGELAPSETQLLREVSAAFGTRPVSGTKVRDASDLPKSTYYRTLKALVDRGLLAMEGDDRRPTYTLTPDGEAAAVPTSPTSPNGTSPVESHTHPSLEGGTGMRTAAEAQR